MLLQTANEPFDDDDYVFEPKSNGVRLLLRSKNGALTYYSRHGNNLTGRIPELETFSLEDCYLDGELVCYRDEKEDFEGVMSRINSSNQSSIESGMERFPLVYVVFDILQFKDETITSLPLSQRKERLNEIVEPSTHMKLALSYEGKGKMLFDHIKQFDLEGIVAKKRNSSYQVGTRSQNWLKIINWRYHTCTISGYKRNGGGWLLRFDNGKFAGLVEFGMTPVDKQAFYQIAQRLKVKETSQYVYIEPVLRCLIKGRGLLFSGSIMTPVFVKFLT